MKIFQDIHSSFGEELRPFYDCLLDTNGANLRCIFERYKKSFVKVRDFNFDELMTRISDLLSSFKHSVKARLARFLVLTDNFPLLPILGALIRHGFC